MLKFMRNESAYRKLRLFRLALSGAIAGVSLVGVFFPTWAYAHGLTADAIGAGAGFTAVLAVKATHLL